VNLNSIARLGAVKSHTELGRGRYQFVPNDDFRLDHHPDMISVTIEYPNVKLLKRWMLSSDDRWVVLCFDPSLLWRIGVLFSPTNAARKSGSLLRHGVEGFDRLYEPQPEVVDQARSERHVRCAPTDVQAEAMIPGELGLDLLTTIVVRGLDDKRALAPVLKPLLQNGADIVACPTFMDVSLIGQVQRGRLPERDAVSGRFSIEDSP
jgi:hypothetical protein